MSAPIFMKRTVVMFYIPSRIRVTMPIRVSKVFTILLGVFGYGRVATYIVRCAVRGGFSLFFVANYRRIFGIFINSRAKVRLFMVYNFVTVSCALRWESSMWYYASSFSSIISP